MPGLAQLVLDHPIKGDGVAAAAIRAMVRVADAAEVAILKRFGLGPTGKVFPECGCGRLMFDCTCYTG